MFIVPTFLILLLDYRKPSGKLPLVSNVYSINFNCLPIPGSSSLLGASISN